jgi:hypothetical protein
MSTQGHWGRSKPTLIHLAVDDLDQQSDADDQYQANLCQ